MKKKKESWITKDGGVWSIGLIIIIIMLISISLDYGFQPEDEVCNNPWNIGTYDDPVGTKIDFVKGGLYVVIGQDQLCRWKDWRDKTIEEKYAVNNDVVVIKTIACEGLPAIITINNTDEEYMAGDSILCDSDKKDCRDSGWSAVHTNHSCIVRYWQLTGDKILEV
ncbi:unnamed protein product [marine sediment metagenome]|uniref:Uncharacterized protein n=1 Tax=marine sediment metagenome TaxID=412755 RepID=X0X392_9ZZZZ